MGMLLKAVTVDAEETLMLENTVPDSILEHSNFRVPDGLDAQESSESRLCVDSSTVRFAKNTVLDGVPGCSRIHVLDGASVFSRLING